MIVPMEIVGFGGNIASYPPSQYDLFDEVAGQQ
jgi:hypothetical protein